MNSIKNKEKSAQQSQRRSLVSANRAEAAVHIASKQAEINREMESSAQRQEIVAQQQKLKMLEGQRYLEAIETEYSVYAKVNAEIRGSKIQATSSQLPVQQHNIVCPQVLQHSVPATFPEITHHKISQKVMGILLSSYSGALTSRLS